MSRVRVRLITLLSLSVLPLLLFFKMTSLQAYSSPPTDSSDFGNAASHEVLDSGLDQSESKFEHILENVSDGYLFNCSNLGSIKKIKELGKGWAKTCFLGEYEGQYLAVKVVTSKQRDIKECLALIKSADAENRKNRARCFAFPSMKFMKEVLLLQTLRHPNLVKLLGYCIRGGEYVVVDALETGDVAVFEFGEPAIVKKMNWTERLQHAEGLTRLLLYFHYSPLGSLGHYDLSFQQFRIVDSKIKLTDLDAVVSYEPRCRLPGDDSAVANQQNVKYTSCSYGLSCVEGKCSGHNAKMMFKSFTSIFFLEMFDPTVFPPELRSGVNTLNSIIHSSGATAEELLHALESMRADFKPQHHTFNNESSGTGSESHHNTMERESSSTEEDSDEMV